jgi:hypothetical protein
MSIRMMAAVAAAFVISSGSAFAAAMDHDPTTGLNTYYYYGPVSELAKKGLPMKDGSSKYTSTSQSNARRQQSPSSLRLLEDRPARVTPIVAPGSGNTGDKASGNLW